MKTVILCGGFGSRLGEITQLLPKPLITVGEQPLLWHIMKIYAKFGHNDFLLTLGYKGAEIKRYFMNYYAQSSDIRIDIGKDTVEYLQKPKDNWIIDLIDTGAGTLTGGRLHRVENQLRSEGTFMLTYGDGVANVDIERLLEFHHSHGKIATVTAVRPTSRFGSMSINRNMKVSSFREKQQADEGWINGGFFVFEPRIFDYLKGDSTVLEGETMDRLVTDGELMAFRHEGFWQCMDTIRERQFLESLWASEDAPWKVW